jgi:Raf kinase inhibitor-like YbhB/YbcL family protein
MKDKAIIIGAMAFAFGALMFSSYAEKHPETIALSRTDRYEKQSLQVSVEGVLEGQPIPAKYAYCVSTATEKSSMTGENISPGIRWSKGPDGTKSYAIVMVDKDVPTDFKNAGIEGKTLPINMKRQDFFHWAAIGISADTSAIRTGDGKADAIGTQAVNDYAAFMKNKPVKSFLGYDGPCPPWNDALIHRYYFYVFALSKEFSAADFPNAKDGLILAKEVPLAITPYILAKGSVMGTYTLNPDFKK